MENPKVKTKVHDPPNLIPGIDIKDYTLSTPEKFTLRQYHFLLPKNPPR